VNPQWHDEFVALCALFPSGELTDEEWAHLQVHLAYCDSCQVTFREYQHLTGNVIPILAASVRSEDASSSKTPSFSLEAAEQRLMNQLDVVPTSLESQKRRKTKWQIPAGLLAASLLGVAYLIGRHFTPSSDEFKAQVVAPNKTVEAPKPILQARADTNLRPELVAAQNTILQLQQQLNTTKEESRQSISASTNAQRQLEAEQAERKKIGEERKPGGKAP
jgi:hypothetical protein